MNQYLLIPFLALFLNQIIRLPSGKHTKNYGNSPCLMGKSTISMANFNSYVKLPEGNPIELWLELIEKPKREIVVMFTN